MKIQFGISGIRIRLFLVILMLLAGFTVGSCRRYESGGNNVVKVKLAEYSMDVENAEELTPGPAVIEITNDGKEEHSFVFEGTDTIQRLEDNIKPGETKTMRVKLEPASYNVYCPLDDHKNKGMSSVIKVEKPDGEGTTTNY